MKAFAAAWLLCPGEPSKEVIILVISAWNVGFLPLQWAALIVATVLLAGLCAWIINWE